MKAGFGRSAIKSTLLFSFILWIVIPSTPMVFGQGLDASWIFGMNMGHVDKLIFGRDIIFTHGPLGYLLIPVFPEAEPWAVFVFDWGIAAATGYALWILIKRAGHWTEAGLVLVSFGFYSAFAWDDAQERMLGAIIALILVIAARLDEQPWLELHVLSVLAAIAFLAKFNLGIMGSLGVFYFAAYFVWRHRSNPRFIMRPLMAVLLVWFSTLVGLYWMLDRAVANLVAFFRNSIDIANGYSSAMAMPGPLWVAIGAVTSCLVLWIAVPLAAGRLRRVLWGMPLLVAISFLCFKSAMVRQDAHALPFPFQMAVLSLMVVALVSGLRSRIVVAAFGIASLAWGVAGVNQWWPNYLPGAMDRLSGVTQLRNLDAFLHWPTTVQRIEIATQRALAGDELAPNFQPNVTGKRVTAYPTEIAMIRANHLKWQPLPVIQAYSAYTPALDSLNAAALDAASGPEAILLWWDTIDGRQPFYETPRSWVALLDWYDLQARSHDSAQNMCVLTRRAAPRFDPLKPAGTTVAHFGQTISLPPVADDEALLMDADVAENLRGTLKRELFRAPIVEVRAVRRSGYIERRRVIQANMKNGVIVCDWPNSLGPLLSMFAGRGAFTKDRVVSISLHTAYPSEFHPEIKIRWSRVKLRAPLT